jgi:hypothetical protein
MFYEALSFAASFFITLLVMSKPRSLLILIALAVALFVLFGVFAIAGFVMAAAIKLATPVVKKQEHKKRK